MWKNKSVMAMMLVAFACWRIDVSAQGAEAKCSQLGYSFPQAHLKSIPVTRIEGQAVYASPAQKWELGTGNGVCVALFNRKTGVRVANVATDDKGQFEFINIAPGQYVLIAEVIDVQKMIIPVQLVPDGKASHSRWLLLHLRDKADPRKSYVTAVTRLALRKELLAMVEEDQKIRDDFIKSGVDHPSKTIMDQMEAIGQRNTARMKEIIKKYGWPDSRQVGWDGTQAAFILVQHADHSFQKQLLPLIEKEFAAGDLSGPNYALFIDRVLAEDGKPQVYGSRAMPFDQWKGTEPVLYPITDEANVNKRRAEVGLSPLAEYRELLKQMYHPQGK